MAELHDIGRAAARMLLGNIKNSDCIGELIDRGEYVIVKGQPRIGRTLRSGDLRVASVRVLRDLDDVLSELHFQREMDACMGYRRCRYEVWHVVEDSPAVEYSPEPTREPDGPLPPAHVFFSLVRDEHDAPERSLPFLLDGGSACVLAALRGRYDVDLLSSLLFDDGGACDSRGRRLTYWANTDPDYISTCFMLCERD